MSLTIRFFLSFWSLNAYFRAFCGPSEYLLLDLTTQEGMECDFGAFPSTFKSICLWVVIRPGPDLHSLHLPSLTLKTL